MTQLRSGNQMVAEGAVKAGCRFFAGYPITPASGIYKGMIDMLQARGDVAISSPDEISALAYCVGASMRGYKAMTATSGPGFALMIETLQYALMTETPVVIAMVQRLGPSTGGATQGAQGDIMLAEFCTSGGYTIPVLCPSTARECYDLTIHAFNLAESLRMPVILLSDKEVGMTIENINYEDFDDPVIVDRPTLSRDETGEHLAYDFEERADVPSFYPVGGTTKVTTTGSAHNRRGELKKNDSETIDVLYHLEEKVAGRAVNLEYVACDIEEDAETLVVSFGVTARAMLEAARIARRSGNRVSTMNVLSLFPIPEGAIRREAQRVTRVVVAEENLNGQYRRLIEPLLPGKEIFGVNKIGSMITPAEILHAIL